ncbi:hypothetical protein [Anaeromyxobacter paludicola]|nr:hypothetical protein [Anaeromyxobacter paludicola]
MAKTFKGAKGADVEEVLTTLAALDMAMSFKADAVRRWCGAARMAG